MNISNIWIMKIWSRCSHVNLIDLWFYLHKIRNIFHHLSVYLFFSLVKYQSLKWTHLARFHEAQAHFQMVFAKLVPSSNYIIINTMYQFVCVQMKLFPKPKRITFCNQSDWISIYASSDFCIRNTSLQFHCIRKYDCLWFSQEILFRLEDFYTSTNHVWNLIAFLGTVSPFGAFSRKYLRMNAWICIMNEIKTSSDKSTRIQSSKMSTRFDPDHTSR